MGTRDMSVGLEVSLPPKDKAWAEAQKRELIINAWALQKDARRGAEAVQGTVRHAGAFLFLGLVFVGGAVVYNARR